MNTLYILCMSCRLRLLFFFKCKIYKEVLLPITQRIFGVTMWSSCNLIVFPKDRVIIPSKIKISKEQWKLRDITTISDGSTDKIICPSVQMSVPLYVCIRLLVCLYVCPSVQMSVLGLCPAIQTTSQTQSSHLSPVQPLV